MLTKKNNERVKRTVAPHTCLEIFFLRLASNKTIAMKNSILTLNPFALIKFKKICKQLRWQKGVQKDERWH